MTSSGDDSGKRPSNPAGRWARPLSDIGALPDDVGGEVLFDDYDDHPVSSQAAAAAADVTAAAADASNEAAAAPAGSRHAFDEDIDDLIVFSEDDEEEDLDEDDSADEVSDEDFDFEDADEDDDDDDDDDEDEDEDEEQEQDDEDEFGFGSDLKQTPRRPATTRTEPSAAERPRGPGRSRPETPQQPSAERARPNVVSGAGDDETYWSEVDRWVWEENKPQPTSAGTRPSDEGDDEDAVEDAPAGESADGGEVSTEEARSGRRRGRRRGGRGRNRRRREESPTAETHDTDSDTVHTSEDDLSEILFEEDHEDVVSVSAGSAVPCEPHEQLWPGTVHPDGSGGFSLERPDGERWPLITLEPALHQWLQGLDRPMPAALVGCRNSAGPWLRVSRLAG